MVARIVSGKSIRGILNYNETKVRNAEAQILMAAGFPRDADGLSFRNKLDRFEMLSRQNEQTRTNALHITLNFSRKDAVDDDLLRSIASEYMDAIGFGAQPFLVYRHYDASHPHIHIATVNIADGGARIETHNIGKYQSEKARKAIENSYNLIRAEDQKAEMAYMLRPVRLEKARYGKTETKAAISGIVREVVSSYRFTSLSELNTVLRQFNVLANRGDPGSRMHEKGGITYHLLDTRGEKVGVPIKASSIYGSPTLRNLERKFGPNREARKPYGLRIRHQLDKAVSEATDIVSLQARLQAQGIRILLRENAAGSVHGITFIDNGTRTVFDGRSLGKQYINRAFLEKIGSYRRTIDETEGMDATTGAERKDTPVQSGYPANELPVIQRLREIALGDGYEVAVRDVPREKKRKNLRTEQQ